MPYYKDKNGGVHYLDSAEFENYLPDGCVSISDVEAADLLKPTADQIKQARIAEIDLALLEIDKRRARALSDAILTGDKTYAQSLEDQAVPLRAERKTLTA